MASKMDSGLLRSLVRMMTSKATSKIEWAKPKGCVQALPLAAAHTNIEEFFSSLLERRAA
jgi:hypothetical protein